MKNKKRNSKGLSLIEASMVLALSAIVISGVMVYYQSASFNNKIKDTMIIVQAANNTIQSVFTGSSNNYEALINDGDFIFMNTASIPDKYKDKNKNKIKNPFGGAVSIGSGAELGGATVKKLYSLRLTDVPKKACEQLAGMNFGNAHKETSMGFFKRKKEELNPQVIHAECKRNIGDQIMIDYWFE